MESCIRANMKKLNVLGQKITTKLIAPKNDDDLAEYDPVKGIIRLTPTSPTICKDFGHEVFHALYRRAGLGQTDIPENIEEILCESFSNFFDDNMVIMYQIYCKLKKIQSKN